jgi:arylsulfatase A-like enzyme
MVVQEPYYSMYPPKTIPVPKSISDPMYGSPYKLRSNQKDQLYYRDADKIKNMRAIYFGMVKEVDDWIGEILTKLDNLGLTENTLVVFTSDHGEMLGDHGMHSKMIFYEGSIHVPLLMRFPKRIKKGTVVNEPVSSLDIFSTILDYMEVSIPTSDGISLKPFIDNNPVDHVVVSHSGGNRTPNYMIRYKNLKLMMGESTKNRGTNGLYNLEADPLEMCNLLVTPVDVEINKKQATEMKKLLVAWMEKHEPTKALNMKKRELY